MEKEVKKSSGGAVLITAIILLLLFGTALFIFYKQGFLSFSGKETKIINDVDSTVKDTDKNTNGSDGTPTKCNCEDDCFDTNISDYDTVQEVNKFWNKLVGRWSDDVVFFEFLIDDGRPVIKSGKHNSEYSNGVIVSIKKEKENVYTFNVVRTMYVGESNGNPYLGINDWNITFDNSYTIDVSKLDQGILDNNMKKVNN